MLPCVPHLINIAQLGGLGRKEQRGIWRAGEAVFAHESEILSEVPAEPERGCARQIAASGREPPRWPRGSARRGFPHVLHTKKKYIYIYTHRRAQRGWAGGRAALGRPRPRLGAGACLGNCKHILKIYGLANPDPRVNTRITKTTEELIIIIRAYSKIAFYYY